ncbi:MAG: glycosyltransferase family 4 protein [Patescibacteria group bacterium]
MKKILIFSTAYYPLVGGAEVAVKEITGRISDIQFDMVTIWLDKNSTQQEKIGNVNIHRIKTPKLLFPFLGFLKAIQLHKKNNYDAIWSIMASYSGFTALFFKLLHPKIPYILTLQEGDPIPEIKRKIFFVYPLFKMVFTKADFIQAISSYLADWARDMCAKCQIEVIPNGVDIERFKIQDSRFRNNEITLITTSRLVKKNAVDDVIEAMQYLPENLKFLILGTGPLENILKFKIKNLKLDGRVLMLGHIDHEDLPSYLKTADIFIRPSLSEGMGNSFIEAMAAGVPVIATPVGGIPDFLKDKETGLFCEINNPKSIAEKVKIYLENDGLRKKIIKNAQEMVVKNYDWNLIAKNMRKKVFEKIFTE